MQQDAVVVVEVLSGSTKNGECSFESGMCERRRMRSDFAWRSKYEWEGETGEGAVVAGACGHEGRLGR